ncbi:MAG: WYL domain-containing protein [Bacteroidales bacterium]|nr:WYL domain-containing protein [Bacteroidales bacterium]HPD96639.1 WYL domain-containing protein [Tenuifilaceae bacterium]HRX31965.1 WYL domain-containing protein [Tenuifilaceae bacterium]
MDQPKKERILRLIQILIGNRKNTKELSRIVECDQRTIQRYIDTIRSVGFVVEYRKRGVPFLSTKKGSLKEISDLVHFSKEEAVILHRAIDSIDDNTVLKQNLKQKLYSIYNFPWLADVIVKPEQGKNIERLTEAIGNEQYVTLENYRSANSNNISNRTVEPFQFTTNYEQIWCYDPTEQKCKLFKIARIGNVTVLEQPWLSKKKHIHSQIDIFRNAAPNFVGEVRLNLNVRAYNLLVEEYPLSESFIQKTDDKQYHLTAPVCCYDGPCRFIMGLFSEVKILGDDGLKKAINEKISMLKF